MPPRSRRLKSGQPARRAASEKINWEAIAADSAFRRLIKDKIRFLIPATLFFIVYYFALPVLVGYAPKLMERPVFGTINLAYLFALSQFFMAWLLAALYVRAALRWDRDADAVVKKIHRP